MHPIEQAIVFLLKHVERHGDGQASVEAARHLAAIETVRPLEAPRGSGEDQGTEAGQ